MISKVSVVIALGGKGTRLAELTKGIPKPLFEVAGYSTLERTLILLKNQNLTNIFLTTCYQSEIVRNFVENFKNKYQLNLEIFSETEPLGECGALWEIKENLTSKVIFINGDIIFSMDFNKLYLFHERLDADMTLVTHPSTHPEDSDMVFSQDGVKVDSILHKNRNLKEDNNLPILGNAGIVIFEKKVLDFIQKPKRFSKPNFFGYVVREYIKKYNKLFHYNTSEYIKDMGTIKRYKKVLADLKVNLPAKKDYRFKQKALFLDRDNTLIKCSPGEYITNIDQIEFLDENIIKISKISKQYTYVAIITNQPQLSMNMMTLKTLENINNNIILYCQKRGLFIDNVRFCPHHPHSGFEGEITMLKIDCFCRKPQPGLLLNEAFSKNIDLSQSLMIGDSKQDQVASENANCKFLHVEDI